MAFQNPNRTPMYPQIYEPSPNESNPFHSESTNSSSSSKSSLYPHIDMVENLFPENNHQASNASPSAPPECFEEFLITVPGAILHLIDKTYSVELACGDLSILRLRQGDNVVAVFARVSDEIQWPLAKDEAAVKLDESHYFFSFKAPKESAPDPSDGDKKSPPSDSDDLLNYGLTIASKGQEGLLMELDKLLEHYSSFSVQKVSEKVKESEVMEAAVAKGISPGDLKEEKKREMMEEHCAAYWTTLAPNVEEYSGSVAKMIAMGSGQLIKGILWCGDVTVDRLKWGNEVMMKRMTPDGKQKEISPETMKRIERVKRVTRMTESVAGGVLSGVVKVSGFFTSSVANSKVGKKFFNLLPGEIVLASLDGFSKVCDAVEVAGKNVMSTSSTVTTGLVSHKYGEEAAKATGEGFKAAGHAAGTVWTVFKLRQALNPKSALKPSSLAKSAAVTAKEMKKSKSSK